MTDEAAHEPLSTDPRALWHAARSLGGEPGEWTFSLFAFRALALEDEGGPDRMRGIDLFYEPLKTWNDVEYALRDSLALAEGGAILMTSPKASSRSWRRRSSSKQMTSPLPSRYP